MFGRRRGVRSGTTLLGACRTSGPFDDPVQAGLWTEAGEWTDIASAYQQGCDQDIAGAWDVSTDGNVVVGLVRNQCTAEAFRWDAMGSGIMTPLERLAPGFRAAPTLPPAGR